MGTGVTKTMKKQFQLLTRLSSAALITVIMMSISHAYAFPYAAQSTLQSKTPIYNSAQFLAEKNRDETEDKLPIKIEMILSEKEWIKPIRNNKPQNMPLKVRITNLSSSPITFKNFLPRAYFDFDIVDENNKSIRIPPNHLGGRESFSYIGDAFPKEKYGTCPIIKPHESIETDWDLKFSWKSEEVLIELNLNPNVLPYWRFKTLRAGTYTVQLNYENRSYAEARPGKKDLCEQEVSKSASNAPLLRFGKALPDVSKIDLVFDSH
jgi:hypothetical protein